MNNIFYSELDIDEYNGNEYYEKRSKITHEIEDNFYKVEYEFNNSQIRDIKFITKEMISNQTAIFIKDNDDIGDEAVKKQINGYKNFLKFEGLVYNLDNNKCYYGYIYTGEDTRRILIAPFNYDVTLYTEDGADVMPRSHKIRGDYREFIKSLNLNLNERYNKWYNEDGTVLPADYIDSYEGILINEGEYSLPEVNIAKDPRTKVMIKFIGIVLLCLFVLWLVLTAFL